DKDDGQPIDPRYVAALGKLDEKRNGKQACHQETRNGRSEADMDSEVVRACLADRRRHDLDHPEDDSDFRNLVQHAAGAAVSNHVDYLLLHERWRRTPLIEEDGAMADLAPA